MGQFNDRFKLSKSFSFANNTSIQEYLLNKFCDESKIMEDYYGCGAIDSLDELTNSKHNTSMWNDFLSIHCNLIQTKLFNLLVKLTNNNMDQVLYLYAHFRFMRTSCLWLPRLGFAMLNSRQVTNQFRTIVNHFEREMDTQNSNNNNNNTNNPILMYYILYHGVTTLFEDFWIYFSRHIKQDVTDRNVFHQVCCDYLIDQIGRTGIFGRFQSQFFPRDSKEHRQNQQQKRQEATNLLKELLFNNEISLLDELIKYCISDISKFESYLVPVKQVKTKKNKKTDSDIKRRHGIGALISTRLSFAAFHDLSIIGKNEQVLLFPKLTKLFKFLYNFSVYCWCYADKTHTRESFLISQYLRLRNNVYSGIFDSKIMVRLKDFVYFDISPHDGTLLHKSVYCKMRYYCQILMSDGFSVTIPNRRTFDETPLYTAKAWEFGLMVKMMQNYLVKLCVGCVQVN